MSYTYLFILKTSDDNNKLFFSELEAGIQGFEARLTSIDGSRCVIVTSPRNETFSETERNVSIVL